MNPYKQSLCCVSSILSALCTLAFVMNVNVQCSFSTGDGNNCFMCVKCVMSLNWLLGPFCHVRRGSLHFPACKWLLIYDNSRLRVLSYTSACQKDVGCWIVHVFKQKPSQSATTITFSESAKPLDDTLSLLGSIRNVSAHIYCPCKQCLWSILHSLLMLFSLVKGTRWDVTCQIWPLWLKLIIFIHK